MANWAYVENGQIVEKYDILPDNWRNISNFFVLQDDVEYLKTLNWFPITKPAYSYDSTKQQLANPRYKIENDIVTEEYDIIDIPKPLPMTLVDVEKMLIEQTQSRLDNFAQSRGYDNILSACSYSNDPNIKFQTEGTHCVQMRSQTWIVLYQIISDIKNEVRSMPNKFSDIENELPSLTWPE